MKKIVYATAITFALTGCQSGDTKETIKGQQLSQEAIAIHDEIMPQIQVFDKTTVRIDSILAHLPAIATQQKGLDTTLVRSDLTTLKTNLESATDFMMTWMHEYVPDSTDVAYQTAEIEKVKAMKQQFDEVSQESKNKLAKF